MMTGTALALAALLAGPVGTAEADRAGAPRAGIAAPSPVPAEMIPAPGRWEVEDAPAYFSDRRAPGDEVAQEIRTDAPGQEPAAATLRGDTSAHVRAAGAGAVLPIRRPQAGAALAAHRP